MWWHDILGIDERIRQSQLQVYPRVHAEAIIEPGVTMDETAGPIQVGSGTRICAGAFLRGPLLIGSDCLIGNQALIRGPTIIGNRVSIGFATEVKQAIIADRASIGPMCFVADSKVDNGAFLGALVRTSNYRLDCGNVTVRDGTQTIDTGCQKLGCWIGNQASLGIQVIVLPGRVIAPGSVFEPRITIGRNHPQGHYRLVQSLETVL